MTHQDIVQFAGTYGLIYVIGMFALAVAYAMWPRNRAKFEKAARIPLSDDTPLPRPGTKS